MIEGVSYQGFLATVRLIHGVRAARFVFSFKCSAISSNYIRIHEDIERTGLRLSHDQWDDTFAIGRSFQLQVEPLSEDLPVSLARGIITEKSWAGNQLSLVFELLEVDRNDLALWLSHRP